MYGDGDGGGMENGLGKWGDLENDACGPIGWAQKPKGVGTRGSIIRGMNLFIHDGRILLDRMTKRMQIQRPVMLKSYFIVEYIQTNGITQTMP